MWRYFLAYNPPAPLSGFWRTPSPLGEWHTFFYGPLVEACLVSSVISILHLRDHRIGHILHRNNSRSRWFCTSFWSYTFIHLNDFARESFGSRSHMLENGNTFNLQTGYTRCNVKRSTSLSSTVTNHPKDLPDSPTLSPFLLRYTNSDSYNCLAGIDNNRSWTTESLDQSFARRKFRPIPYKIIVEMVTE